jgi:hypothetical protein
MLANADRERKAARGPEVGPPRPFMGSDVVPWLTHPNREMRRQLSAEWRARTLANPDHDAWHRERGVLYKSANLAMQAAIEMSTTGECTMRIDPDSGAIIGTTED